MIRSSVDLPHPDGPISETNSPSSIVRSMPWSAVVWPNVFETPLISTTLASSHATFSGARRTMIFSAIRTIRKKLIPSAAAMTFVAHNPVGWMV